MLRPFVVLYCWLVVPWLAVAVEANRFNVLFIAIDDLRPELGCYGIGHAQSPNLDAFAQRALRFDRHYVQVATCGASRYCLLTGRSPHRSGVTRGNDAFYAGKTAFRDEELPGAQSLPELFRRGGYQTSLLGKISHTADGLVYAYDGSGDGRREMPQAWDELLTPLGDWKRGWGIFFAYAGGRHREDGSGKRDLTEFVVDQDEDLPDGLLARAAIEQLSAYQRRGDRFFLGLGFFKPHLPFVAPKQDWEAFEETPIPLPPTERIDSPYWHPSREFYGYHTDYEKSQPLGEAAMRESKRGYLACVRYVDRQVGKVLDQLDKLELRESTVVVVWGDHGWHLGEQQIWAKHTPFERATRSVLMMSVPGMKPAGQVTHALAATVDIYPTLLEVCNPAFRHTQHELDGTSLVPLLQAPEAQVRSTVTSYWGNGVTVRDQTHRLIATMQGHVPTYQALYDLSQSQDDSTDIAQQHPEIVDSLMRQLHR